MEECIWPRVRPLPDGGQEWELSVDSELCCLLIGSLVRESGFPDEDLLYARYRSSANFYLTILQNMEIYPQWPRRISWLARDTRHCPHPSARLAQEDETSYAQLRNMTRVTVASRLRRTAQFRMADERKRMGLLIWPLGRCAQCIKYSSSLFPWTIHLEPVAQACGCRLIDVTGAYLDEHTSSDRPTAMQQ